MILSNIEGIGHYSTKLIKVKCDICGVEKETKFKNYTALGYDDGNYVCRNCNMKRNNLEKYGVENVFQLEEVKNKMKQTNFEKYGVEYISQSKEIQDKIKETSLERYGTEHMLQCSEIRQKGIMTNLLKYGVENISQLDKIKEIKKEKCNLGTEEFKNYMKEYNLEEYGVESSLSSEIIKEKIKKTNLEKYGYIYPSDNPLIRDKIRRACIETNHNRIYRENPNIVNIDDDNKTLEIYCHECQATFEITNVLYYKRREMHTCICTNCNKVDKHQSGKEILLQQFISNNYDGTILYNYRLDNKELDIYLPNLSLAFEFNGIYWHSDKYRPKNYHYDKTELCKANNIQLIHIWEDDWDLKQELIKTMILNKLGKTNTKIFARKCIIREVENNDAKTFLNENHIQGYVNSSIKLGLYYNNVLVSIMTFKKDKDTYNLNRFCSNRDVIVIGGASKLVKYFAKNYSNKIYTFSDNCYSYGDLYKKIGFREVYKLKPDYHYIDCGVRIHKFNYRKKDTSDVLKIYDAGKIKYEYI